MLTAETKAQKCHVAFKGDVWCPFPLKVDTYQGCGHECLYCSARLQRRTAYQRTFHVPRSIESLKRQMAGRTESTAWKLALEGLTIQWGYAADPFPPIEIEHKTSLDALRLFAHVGLSISICTKSTIPGQKPYLQELKRLGNKVLFRMSLSTLDDETAAILEPNAPPPSERLALLRRLKDAGLHTLVRLSPTIPGVTFERVTPEEIGKTLRRLREACDYVNFHPLQVDFRSEDTAWKPMFEALGLSYSSWKKLYLDRARGRESHFLTPADHWRTALIRNARQAADEEGVKVGFDSGPGTMGAFLSDGPTCCGGWDGIRHNPDAIIPMVRDGRVNSMEFKRDFSLPPKHLGEVRAAIYKLFGKARRART